MFVVSINKEHLSVRDTNGTNNGTYGIIMQTNTISMLKLKAIYTIIELVWSGIGIGLKRSRVANVGNNYI